MDVGLARFFFNAVDTKTQGADLTVTYDFDWANAHWSTYFGANYNKTEVTQVNTPPALVGREDVLLPERDELFIENGAPRSKAHAARRGELTVFPGFPLKPYPRRSFDLSRLSPCNNGAANDQSFFPSPFASRSFAIRATSAMSASASHRP